MAGSKDGSSDCPCAYEEVAAAAGTFRVEEDRELHPADQSHQDTEDDAAIRLPIVVACPKSWAEVHRRRFACFRREAFPEEAFRPEELRRP